MHDTGKIIGGLIIFLVLATSPLWYNALSASTAEMPEVEPPPNLSQVCVESKEYMRSFHMDLLNEWRDDVVRTGERDYVSTSNGRTFDMSLSRTCMDCHSNKADFCDRCHNYADLHPNCWNCHVDPKGK